MHSAAIPADGPAMPKRNVFHFTPSPLARKLSIVSRRTKALDRSDGAQRAAVVLRPGMRPTEFRRVEEHLERNNLARVPVTIVGGKLPDLPSGPLAAMVVTGTTASPHLNEVRALQAVVQAAANRDIPILALTDAAFEVTRALGQPFPAAMPAGVLISGDLKPLKTFEEVGNAIDEMSRAA